MQRDLDFAKKKKKKKKKKRKKNRHQYHKLNNYKIYEKLVNQASV